MRRLPARAAVAIALAGAALSPTAVAAIPAPAIATAAPRWETVARDGSYAWHDRRIRGAAGAWRVPLRVGDTPATIAGDVRRAAATGGGGIGLVLAFFGPAVLVLAAALFLGRRERRSLTTTVEAW